MTYIFGGRIDDAMVILTKRFSDLFNDRIERRVAQKVTKVATLLHGLQKVNSVDGVNAINRAVLDMNIFRSVRERTDEVMAPALAMEFAKVAHSMARNGQFCTYYCALGSTAATTVLNTGYLKTGRALAHVYAEIMPMALHPEMRRKNPYKMPEEYLAGAKDLWDDFKTHDPEDRGREFTKILKEVIRSEKMTRIIPTNDLSVIKMINDLARAAFP